MLECISQFKEFQDIDAGLEALRLRKYMTSPHRILVRIRGTYKDYFFDPLISLCSIQKLNEKIGTCKSEQEVEDLVAAFTKYRF